MEKAGFENFKPEIDNLLMDIEKNTPMPNKKRKEEDVVNEQGGKLLKHN